MRKWVEGVGLIISLQQTMKLLTGIGTIVLAAAAFL